MLPLPSRLQAILDDAVAYEPMSGCHLWTRAIGSGGYGSLTVGGKTLKAHRVAYELRYGPIPDGLVACHRCDTPSCINPAHLFIGTHGDNARDRESKQRRRPATGERHGSRTHPERLARGDRNGSRLHPERLPRGEESWSRLHPELVARGERTNSARLTAEQVIEIRARYSSGGVTLTALGAEYGVTFQQIHKIVRGKDWRHLA
jgi:hypothetical protein